MQVDAQTSRARPHGFSLIELAIVVALIAVLGAIAVPRFANAAARQRLESAANKLEADLALAQQRARARSGDYHVTFSPAQDYTLAPPGGAHPQTTDLTAEPYRVSVGFQLNNGGNVLTYNGFGYPDTGGSITLSGAGNITLDIDPATGGVARR